jgi:hypothetical protein
MSEKWISWKSHLISIMGGEDNLTRPPTMLLAFFCYSNIHIWSQNYLSFSILCSPDSLAPQVS